MSELKLKLILLFLLSFYTLKAQDAVSTAEQLIADIFEQYTAESEDVIDYETFYDELINFTENPININNSSREELEHLPFLSDNQIENILSYVYRFGSLKTIYELQLIDGLDMTDIRRMLPFISIGEGSGEKKKLYFQDLLKYGKNELYFRMDKGIETKEGYRFLPEDENIDETSSAAYLGNAVYNSLKYRFHYKDRVLFGITAEKDAGEQFWGTSNKGYDYYSAHVQLNDFGKFKTIVLGDFRANFGQGLVLRPEFGMGKSSYVLNVSPRNSGLKKYSSVDEYNFFRGGGVTFRLNEFNISAFYSNKMIDADTINGSFSSIYKTGLHRTTSDFDKKHTVNQQIVGGNITYTYSNFQLGFTAVHTLLDNKLEPEKSVYNYFYFSGIQQTTAGLHYRMRWQKLNLFGETAITGNGSMATLNGFSFSPVSKVSMVVLHRYFSPEYDTFYATAFSESSRINNETGFYMGVEIRPFSKWKFSAYADSYRFFWPKFGVDAPTLGTDYLLQVDFAFKRDVNMFWRFKSEEKPVNFTDAETTMPTIVSTRKSSLRYNLNYSFRNFSFKNVIEGNIYKKGDENISYGMTALQDLSYRFIDIPIKMDFRYQIFDAQNYENRFYTYEKDILYAFSIPMYYGLGSRYYLNFQYEINKNFSIWFKIAQTVYADDRETISSGNEEISGNRKTDVRCMLKWEF